MQNVTKEEDMQISVIAWANEMEYKWPVLRYLYHCPNGGKRNISTAMRLKSAGVKRGVPDLCLPVPLNGYAGMYIELKIGKNKPTFEQKAWINGLREMGYYTKVCYTFEDTTETIEKYLTGKIQKQKGEN